METLEVETLEELAFLIEVTIFNTCFCSSNEFWVKHMVIPYLRIKLR
jgi:hypothetical protein